MAGVQVTFGANIAPLVDGINSIKGKLNHLAEAFGAALSVDGIKNFVEGMATLGSQSATVAAQLGVSNAQVVALSGYAALGGQSTAQFATEFERLTLNVQRSTRDALNPTAQALHVLGLNARDLIGLSADQYFDKLAEAASRFNPSLNLTNALMQAGGRGIAALLPILLQGKQHLEEFQHGWEEASEGLAAAIPGMDQTHEKLLLLDQSATSFGARIFSVLKPAIDAAISAISRWLQSFHQNEMRDAVNEIGGALITVAQDTALFFIDAGEDWEKLISTINSGMPALHAAAAALLFSIGQFGLGLEQAKEALNGIGAAKPFALIEHDAQAASDKVNALAASSRDALNANVPKSGTGAAMGADLLGIQQNALDAMQAAVRQNAAATNEDAAAQLANAQSAIQEQIASIDEYFAKNKEGLSADLAAHRITFAQETASLIAEIEKRDTSEQTWYASEVALLKDSGKNWEAIEKEKTAAHAKAMLEIHKATDAAAKEEIKLWKSAADQIAGAINGQLQKILSGHETLKQGLQAISGQIALKFLEDQIKVTVEWLANQARILAGHIATEAGMTAASTAGAAARAAADTAAGSTSILEDIANALRAIGVGAGQTSAAVAAEAAPAVGPAAPAIGAAAGASVLATALGFMSSFDVGTDRIMRGGLAMVHQGETIIPARGSGPFTGAGMGGDTHVHNWNISAVDGTSVQRWLGGGGARQIANAVAGVQKLTPSTAW